MQNSIENKIILVTGASRGIGYATSLKLAEYGAQLILAARNLNDLENIREKIQTFGKTPSIVQTNVTEKNDLENLFSIINKDYGKLDGAFNNSGILENPNHLHDIQEEEFWDLVKTNIYGTWMCMKNEINLMLKRKSGSIVNCSSINGLKGNPKHPIYSATKHAIIGLTKSAAISYAKKSIRVNAVSPGPTETKMMTKIDQSIPEKKQSINNWIPLGRYASPEEVAESVIWLLSNKSNYITGSVISIDGGVSA